MSLLQYKLPNECVQIKSYHICDYYHNLLSVTAQKEALILVQVSTSLSFFHFISFSQSSPLFWAKLSKLVYRIFG